MSCCKVSSGSDGQNTDRINQHIPACVINQHIPACVISGKPHFNVVALQDLKSVNGFVNVMHLKSNPDVSVNALSYKIQMRRSGHVRLESTGRGVIRSSHLEH